MKPVKLALLAVAMLRSPQAGAQIVGRAVPPCMPLQGVEAPASLLDSVWLLISQRGSQLRSEPDHAPWRQTGAVVEVQPTPPQKPSVDLHVWWQPGWWRPVTGGPAFPEGPPLAYLRIDDSIVYPLGPAGITFVSSYDGSAVDFTTVPLPKGALWVLARARAAVVRLVRRPVPHAQPDSETRVVVQPGDLRAMAAAFAAAACPQAILAPRRERSN